MDGWIKLHRQITEWEWYTDKNTLVIFLHLILCACFKSTRWCGRELSPGQYITSVRRLCADTGLSVAEVRGALKKLCKTGEIVTETTNKYTLITIVKYNDYQCLSPEDNKQITSYYQASDKQGTNAPQAGRNHNNNINNTYNSNISNNDNKILVGDVTYTINPSFVENANFKQRIVDMSSPVFYDLYVSGHLDSFIKSALSKKPAILDFLIYEKYLTPA